MKREVSAMKRRMPFVLSALLFFGVFIMVLNITLAAAAEPPKQPVTIKVEGAKMPPVTFPHATHVDKHKIECVKCHHKDPQSPKACTNCHGKEAKGTTPSAKDAFHKVCQDCHKEMTAKGTPAPTKCGDCHKK
jgi:hypothetical protein